MTPDQTQLNSNDLDALRKPLENSRGREYWRSLNELAQTEAFSRFMYNEFPAYDPSRITSVTRRNFLQVMGASLALAGLTTGCARQPTEYIFPYVKPPEEIVPGQPTHYASAFVMGGFAKGVLVESHTARPTKIEGLPDHPSSLGATDAFTQASILGLYDPDRSQVVQHYGAISNWANFVNDMQITLDTLRPRRGEGIRILTETVTSPTLAAQIQAVIDRYPAAKWHQYEPVNRDAARLGVRQAFGEDADLIYHFDEADVVVTLDSDFLMNGPAHVRHARDFAKRRDVVDHHDGEHHALNRIYAIESTPSNTGTMADHRYPVRASEVELVARALARKLGISVPGSETAETSYPWLDAIAADLQAHRRGSIVIAGDHQPPAVHALASLINHALGNFGATITAVEAVEANPVIQHESLRELVHEMNAGTVELLLILDGNPAYTAPIFAVPADADNAESEPLTFASAMRNVKTCVHLSLYDDETSELSHWHIPRLHYLESWGDARAHDGTVSLIQPVIAPLYGGKTPEEVLNALLHDQPMDAYNIVRSYWQTQPRAQGNFEGFWAQSLSQGVINGTASQAKTLRPASNALSAWTAPESTDGFEVVFLPDPTIWDGSFANNAWLQEIPKALTKITWDNVIILGLNDPRADGLKNEDLVELSYQGRSVRGAVWLQPGHPTGMITVHLGYGRRRVGKVGNDMGFDAYSIRFADTPFIARGATLQKLAGTYPLARTEEHFNITMHRTAGDRQLVREYTQAEYEAHPELVHHATHEFDPAVYTLYDNEEKKWDGNKWGMTIDLNQCIGCNACIVACQSENNIPVVGKSEVRMGREMHWIRVDRYYSGLDTANPRTNFQPVPCMQCENAPCEVVCPVGATQHSHEGLNDMVYNRCIGTRYCSNNCPYKVRRFNFYNYSRTPMGRQGERMFPKESGPHHVYPETVKLMYNPNVTVRTRGVMEKCTYCVQRINAARIEAKNKGQEFVADDAVKTACQQACPSAAITFGNLHAPDSKLAELKKSHRNYVILGDLNTRPRTSYLARLTNPNPELEA